MYQWNFPQSLILLGFSLTVKAATLIFISGCGSVISSAKEGKSGFIYNLVIGALLKFKFSKKTYLIVIKDETGLKFKMNDSTLFLIGSYAQKLVASY